MARRLIQLIPSHHEHDAAGSEVIVIEKTLRNAGWVVETFADTIDDGLTGKTKPYKDLDQDNVEDAIALYHYCAASEMSYRFLDLDCPKIIIYHNITPAEFFEPYNKNIAIDCREGRKQLNDLVDFVDLAIAHSEYSRLELEELDFEVTRNIPFLFDNKRLDIKPDAIMMQRLSGKRNILFVGRIAPNKRPQDFILTASEFFKHDPESSVRFVLVGKRHVLPKFTEEIDQLLSEVDLTEDQLLITDEVTDSELAACYHSASLFLSLSQHEGFCVPLLEAMKFGVPIAALDQAAVPETLGNAGLLFADSSADHVSGIVSKMLDDHELQQEFVGRGKIRYEHFDPERWRFVFKVLMEQM